MRGICLTEDFDTESILSIVICKWNEMVPKASHKHLLAIAEPLALK